MECSSAWTRRAITGTLLPPAEASTTIARRSRTVDPATDQALQLLVFLIT
ncbi:hypothetical protein [Micromonospora saelicesensis]|nr:hypothetical protein [Micromonospora saelicesensis]